MTNEFKEHVLKNRDVFKMWIENKEQLQKGMDILKPIIPEYKKVNPINNLESNCQDCILDMLIWALIQVKEPNKKKNNAR
jgi:hypothetical protein